MVFSHFYAIFEVGLNGLQFFFKFVDFWPVRGQNGVKSGVNFFFTLFSDQYGFFSHFYAIFEVVLNRLAIYFELITFCAKIAQKKGQNDPVPHTFSAEAQPTNKLDPLG